MNEIERRHEPFSPDRKRVVYPVDYDTSQQYALAKFDAEVRVEVGSQLAYRAIERSGELEDSIRAVAHDEAEYAELQILRRTFMAASARIIEGYMNPRRR